MAMQLTIGASSSTCVSVSPKKYDVFISYDEYTRCKFTSHLNEALRKIVTTFIDDSELEKGDEFSSALVKAIEESYASIVIFSKDYASSKWCLNELVKILECKKDNGQIVIPIFYEIDPSHVRNQIGSYGEAFAKHEQNLKHSKEMLQKWKDALTEASNLAGWDSHNYRFESDLIKKIVEDVLKQLNHRQADKQICSQFNNWLNRDDSLQLFRLKAFGEKHANVGYEELSERAIGYCRGNPLALNVLGANLRTKSKQAWESELEKIKDIPYARIHDVLKLSFIDLDRTQRDIFLDIACLFCQIRFYCAGLSQREYLISLYNACKFHPDSAIKVLLDKALITFDIYDHIKMHDLLVEMGREIVKQEFPKDPGRRSRLWDTEEVYDLLKYNKGTDVVEAILFDTSKMRDLYLSSKSFESMINLRFLHITNEWDDNDKVRVHLPEGLEWLSDKLSHLYWESFPLESLPSTFCAERLVQLIMNNSKLKKLWDGIQKLDNLTVISLCSSKDLIEIPDLSRAPNLQILSLTWCSSLRQLHPSIFTAPKLKELNLRGCISIESLKTIHSKSLQTLDLSECSSLVEFSVTSQEMTYLSLAGTAINELIWQNSKLHYLNLSECWNLNLVCECSSYGTGLGSLTTRLNLSGCTQINTSNLWFILDGARSLKELDLNRCYNLETLPDNILKCLVLEMLVLKECRNLESLPKLPASLQWLCLDECRNLECCQGELPASLQRLYLDDCRKLKSLPKLPASLQKLEAINCISLDTDSIQREMLDKMLDINYEDYDEDFFLLPGAQVPNKLEFYSTNASIVLPPISKYGLSYFVLCVILSKGLDVDDGHCFRCTIYEHGKKVHQWEWYIDFGTGELELNHVLLKCWSDIEKLKNESGGDHYKISFEFKHWTDAESPEEGFWSNIEIKGCGVSPIYDSSKVKIVELQSSGQVPDDSDKDSKLVIDELKHQAVEADLEVRFGLGCRGGLES